MARRADHTREELRELAIEAGIELIEKEGFSNFSARKVAAHIGYTVGTIYNVFSSYDGLITHINARTLDDLYAAMERALAKGKKQGIHTMAHAYIEYSRTRYQRWIVLFEHHNDVSYTLPGWYMEKLVRFFTLTEKLLSSQLGNNRRKTKRAARVLWAGIHGICVLSLSGKLDLVDADSADTLALSLIDNYMAGLTGER